jgi:hypothetical protein
MHTWKKIILLWNKLQSFFVKQLSIERLEFEKIGYWQVDEKVRKTFIESSLFKTINPQTDDVVGIFSKVFTLKDASDNDTRYIVIIVLMKVPFQALFLDYKFADRPSYCAEVFFKEKKRDPQTPAYREVIYPTTLAGICKSMSDEKTIASIALEQRNACKKQ